MDDLVGEEPIIKNSGQIRFGYRRQVSFDQLIAIAVLVSETGQTRNLANDYAEALPQLPQG